MDEGLKSSVNYSGWIMYRARQACTPYLALHALVDFRIIEVSNAHVHLVGSAEKLPYCRLWVGGQPNPEMARDLSAVEKRGRRLLAPARALQRRLSWVESLVVCIPQSHSVVIAQSEDSRAGGGEG